MLHYLSFILSKRFQSFILSISKLEHLHNSYSYDQYLIYVDNYLFFQYSQELIHIERFQPSDPCY